MLAIAVAYGRWQVLIRKVVCLILKKKKKGGVSFFNLPKKQQSGQDDYYFNLQTILDALTQPSTIKYIRSTSEKQLPKGSIASEVKKLD